MNEQTARHPKGFDWNRLQSATPENPLRVLFSACLLGHKTFWDGDSYTDALTLRLSKLDCVWPVAFCPEDVALGTPRPLTTIYDGDGKDVWAGRARVLDTSLRDVSAELMAGAQAMLNAARRAEVELAVMAEGSDSCGSHQLTFGDPAERRYQQGTGVAAALLLKEGIPVLAQRDAATLGQMLALLDPSFSMDPEALDSEDHPWFKDYFREGPVGLKRADYEQRKLDRLKSE